MHDKFPITLLAAILENHIGRVICKNEVWISCAEGVKEIVLVEVAPLITEELIH